MLNDQIFYFDSKELDEIKANIFEKLDQIIPSGSGGNVGWSKKREDLSEIFDAVQSIQLKQGYRLERYTYGNKFIRSTNEVIREHSYVFGFPKELSCPNPQGYSSENFCDVKPNESLHFFQVIEGDKSPRSYIEASILYRVLCLNDLDESRLNFYPPSNEHDYINEAMKAGQLTWLLKPSDWQAVVTRIKGWFVYVQFNSFSKLNRLGIYSNVDIYHELTFEDKIFGRFSAPYAFDSERSTLAIGSSGIVPYFG